MSLPAALASLERRAAVAQVGGFRPPTELLTSWMGTVRLAAAGEAWPTADGEPMHGVLQLLTRDLPVRPPVLDDVELLTLFVAEDLPVDTPNGVAWCLRTYDRVDALGPLEAPRSNRDPSLPKDFEPALKPFPLAFSEVTDWPGLDNVPFDLISTWSAHTHREEDRYRPRTGLKVGGWPFCIQSEVAWYDETGGELPDVDFVLQVDSDDKVGFVVVDSASSTSGAGVALGSGPPLGSAARPRLSPAQGRRRLH